jgi:CRISPR-associated endonuclease Csn1
MDYTEANLALGVHHSQDELDNPDRKLLEKLVYSKKDDDLRNPLVNKTVSETIRLVNVLIATYGKPDLVRIEFARSLQKPKKFREEELARNRDKNLRREEYLAFLHARIGQHLIRKSDLTKFELWLEMEFNENELKNIAPQIDVEEFRKFTRNVNSRDKTKFDLWLECGRISPYTGKIISLSKLFSPEIEVEHIIPYSISQDNSFINLTLSEKSFNDKAKRNRTPLQAFELLGEAEMLGFRKRVSHFSEGKQKRLLFDGSEEQLKKFRPSDLANTAYISKVVRQKLLTAVQKVQVTNGQVTAKLREFWDLNEILNPEGVNEKSRLDHRHHAIDAIAIAFSSPALIQKLSREATFDHRGRMRVAKFDSPFPGFQEKVKEVTDGIFVSYRVESRLLVEKQNKYIHSTSKGQKPQRTITVRGALHEETYYGQIQNSETGKQNYVTRKPLSIFKKLEDLDKIVDKSTRQRLLDFLESKGAKTEKQIQEALAGGFFYKSKDGTKDIPVYKVRIINSSTGMIQVRPKENPNIWVKSGRNHIFAIYEGTSGKRSFSVFSVFDSVKQLTSSGQLVKPFDEQGLPLLYTFQKNEMFIRYFEHPDEIQWDNKKQLFERLYRVVQLDINGNFISTIHNINAEVRNLKLYPPGVILKKTYNSWRGIKVKISAAGEIEPA